MTSLYLHQRFTIFYKEAIEKVLSTIDWWYKIESKYHATGHVYKFIWLPNKQNMDKIKLINDIEVKSARKYFDKYVSTRNPRDASHRDNIMYQSPLDNPCFLDT